jgi:membrane-associated phospholipid phosphatase
MTDSLREALEENRFGDSYASSAVLATSQTDDLGKGALLLAAAASLGLLYWLAVAVLSGDSLAFDESVLRYLHRYANAHLEQFASIVCMLVTVTSVLVLAFLVARRRWRPALFWFCSTAGAAILCGLAKKLMQRHRPDLWHLASPHASFSFPSGHAAQSMAIVVALLLLATPARRSALLIPGLAFIALVGVCRVYLGLHYPTDILAGWMLSLSWVCLLGALSGMPWRR